MKQSCLERFLLMVMLPQKIVGKRHIPFPSVTFPKKIKGAVIPRIGLNKRFKGLCSLVNLSKL